MKQFKTRGISTDRPQANNGVSIEAISGPGEATKATAEAARLTWRANCEWINGVHSRSTISGFSGFGRDQERGKKFIVEADYPKVFGAKDQAPSPVELVLSALASCLTAGVAIIAQQRNIQLTYMEAIVEGDMEGPLGINPEIRNGFSAIRVSFVIDAASATIDELKALVAQSEKRSAVLDIISNPTIVTVEVK